MNDVGDDDKLQSREARQHAGSTVRLKAIVADRVFDCFPTTTVDCSVQEGDVQLDRQATADLLPPKTDDDPEVLGWQHVKGRASGGARGASY